MDILLMLFSPGMLFLLFGWAVSWYLRRRGEKLWSAVALLVWLALFVRMPIPLFLLGDMLDGVFSNRDFFAFYQGVEGILLSYTFVLVPVLAALFFYGLFSRQFMMAALAIALIIPAHLSYLEGYVSVYPLFDTKRSEQFTLQKFDSIRPGMSRAEVYALIGDPVDGAGGYFFPCEAQTRDDAAPFPYDLAWLDSAVCYDESGRVTATKKGWVPD